MADKFSVTITRASKDLTRAEQIKLTTLNDSVGLDTMLRDATNPVVVDVDYYAILHIDNPNGKNGPVSYNKIVIVDEDGTKYITGSSVFIREFTTLSDLVEGEPFSIRVLRKPTKSDPTRHYLTCMIA